MSKINVTKFYLDFNSNIEQLKIIKRESYIRKLIYANIITLMETYLSSTLRFTIEKESLFLKIAKNQKFNTNKITLEKALINDMNKYLLSLLDHILYHNISDVNILYKDIFDIQVNITPAIRDAIENRHHIVHRNGYDLKNDPINIQDSDIDTLMDEMSKFIKNIDGEVLKKFPDLQAI